MKLDILSKILKKKWNCVGLAFAFTFLAFIGMMIVKQIIPFGDASFLYSDSYHQYYPFFLAFRRALRSGESLLYSWNVGMGMDYLGLIAYYLASPLNLISVILPESWMLVYFTLLTPIKLSFASMFFALFLKKTFDRDDISVALFSCFYGMCAWSMAYLWNIMWLDTFALLPLVILGMVSLLKERKFLLYTITLFLSVFSNYYIGFFTCIFVLLVFFCYEICRWVSFRKFFIDLGLMALFSILAIAMTAILELPALAALQTTQSSVNNFPKGFVLNIANQYNLKGLLGAMRQVAGNMNGGLEPSFKDGLPNLYCGLFANAFGILFLFSKNIRIRDKVCAVLLLLFFNVSFIIRQLDYIWHGFHFTNMIPYRFSFLHSFVLLYMAYRAYLEKEEFRLWQIICAAVLSLTLVFFSDSRSDWMYLAYNIVFLLLYFFSLIYPKLQKKPSENTSEAERREWKYSKANIKQLCSFILMIAIVLEMVLNLLNFGTHFTTTSTAYYPQGKEYAASMIRYMHEREEDELFFRAEVTHSQTLNDGALNNYNGISTFTSSANVKVTRFMQRLGFAAQDTYNRYCFDDSSPVANMFLNLKYMIERDNGTALNPLFNYLHSYGNVHLLENSLYLPLGFLVDEALADLDFASEEDAFLLQNMMVSAATGDSREVWESIFDPEIDAQSTEITDMSSTGFCMYSTDDQSTNINYRYVMEDSGYLCTWINVNKDTYYSISVNDQTIYSDNFSLPLLLSIGHVNSGDVVDINFSCKPNESGTIFVRTAMLNTDVFINAYAHFMQSLLELTDFSSTKVEGTIQCHKDGLLYTSIPQDGNWQAYVDGEPAEIRLVGDAMVAVPLTEGYHEVSFRYHNKAFAWGWKISLLSAAAFVGLYFWIYPARKKQGKYTK